MKATLRKSGRILFTITIKQHIGLEEIKEAILSEQDYNKDNSIKSFKEFKSRKKVIDIIKTHLESYGSEIDYSIEEDIRSKFEVRALENTLKLFPELKESK